MARNFLVIDDADQCVCCTMNRAMLLAVLLPGRVFTVRGRSSFSNANVSSEPWPTSAGYIVVGEVLLSASLLIHVCHHSSKSSQKRVDVAGPVHAPRQGLLQVVL